MRFCQTDSVQRSIKWVVLACGPDDLYRDHLTQSYLVHRHFYLYTYINYQPSVHARDETWGGPASRHVCFKLHKNIGLLAILQDKWTWHMILSGPQFLRNQTNTLQKVYASQKKVKAHASILFSGQCSSVAFSRLLLIL